VNRYVFYALLALGLCMRLAMLTHYDLVNGGEVDVYLADEGVVGLMAKHILEGKNLPIFFYGQDYLGALEAYCAALSFGLFGTGVLSLRLVPFLFSLGVLAVVYRLTYKAYSVAAARWATAIVAVAPAYFLQWNLKARGGFVEHVFLLFVLMILFWRLFARHDRSSWLAFATGVVAGVAMWVNQLAIGYVAAMAALLALTRPEPQRVGLLVAGAVLGASLLIGYNVVHPLATVRALGRKAVVLNRVPVQERDDRWLLRGVEKRVEALSQGAAKLGLVFGVPPAEDVERLGLTAEQRAGGPWTPLRRRLWPLPLVVFGAGLIAARPRRGIGGWEPVGSSQLLALFAAITFVIGYVSPRYMLPAYPLAAMLLAALLTRLRGARRRLVAAGAVAVLVFNVASWADARHILGDQEQDRGDELVAFLSARGLTRCYSAAPLYHLVFASGERVVLAPLQKDRYPAYNRLVEGSDAVCYVFRSDQASKRQHLAMMALLAERGVSYRQDSVGPYRVLSQFEPRDALDRAAVARLRSAGRRAGEQERDRGSDDD